MGTPDDDRDEAESNLRQNLATARRKIELMTIARTAVGMGQMAGEAARQIEDLFAVGGMSRDQRLLNVTNAIRRQLAIACTGEAPWDA